MPLLEVKNLHVEIDGKKILNGLDLTIEKGKVHAIMGPNGSGKSTLAYVLAGKTDYQLTAGEVLFDGEDISISRTSAPRAASSSPFQYPMENPRRSGARRHPLRHAAARALRRHAYLPRVLRSLQ